MRRISHWSLGHEPIRLINEPTVTSLAALGSVVVTATDHAYNRTDLTVSQLRASRGVLRRGSLRHGSRCRSWRRCVLYGCAQS
jgi:hypothetical protein